METKTKIHARIGLEPYVTTITVRGHELIGDELPDNGGKDLGLTPTEMVLSGLASCTAATLKMYAERKSFPMSGLSIDVGINTEKNADGSQVSTIYREIRFEGSLDEGQKERLLQIADKCPVHRLLTNQIVISTSELKKD